VKTPVSASRAFVAGPHAPHQLDGQGVQEIEFRARIDDCQSIGLGDLRSDLRQMLRARDADRNRQAKLRAHTAPHRFRDFRRRAEQARGAGDIGEGFVDGDALDGRREIAQHVDGGVAEPLIVLEMAADENELRTKLARAPSGHAAANAEGSGLIRSREHHAAADGDRLAPQRRIEQLLDRGIEGVEVRVEDRGLRFHPNTSTGAPAIARSSFRT
jgi:hypothetical protein